MLGTHTHTHVLHIYIHISALTVSFIAVLNTAVVAGCHARCRISVCLTCHALVSDQTNTVCVCMRAVCMCVCVCV
jgi:hypothetical protein